VNDYWIIPKIDELGTLHVKVYSRNGLLVYESTNYTNNWDGTWKNMPLPAGSYYYIIDSSAKGIIKGVVNIIR
jgi:gliding motility-associated-like protein